MDQHHSEEAFKGLTVAFLQGNITRRRFLQEAAQLGVSATLLSRMAPAALAADGRFVDASPTASYESPVTQERIEYLKTKPYQNATINVLVLQSAVGACVKYHAPRWEEETGAHVNLTEAPIDTLHPQIFEDLTKGVDRYDAYQTAAWFYGDYFTPKEPYIIE